MESKYYGLEYANSAELCEKMAQICDVAILMFSTGKDSIGAWLQMRRYFKHIVPVYKYFVPGLQFVEDSLKYYEDFFGQHIYRMPNPALFRYIRNAEFQPPHRCAALMEVGFVDKSEYNDDILCDIIRTCGRLSEDAYVATGVRAADNPIRRANIMNRGAIYPKRKSFLPIYDWNKATLMSEIDAAGVKLPVDYKIWGRTFDGLHYAFQRPMKDCLPDDYAMFLRWFPMADLEILRWEGSDAKPKLFSEVSRFE